MKMLVIEIVPSWFKVYPVYDMARQIETQIGEEYYDIHKKVSKIRDQAPSRLMLDVWRHVMDRLREQ